MSDPDTADDAWSLTRAISKGAHVRVASVDAAGTVLNQYARSRSAAGDRPDAPWAVHLATDAGFHLLALDFDSKQGAAAAADDADTTSTLLTRFGIEHLVCQSGPTGGRHVWIALAAAATPELVATFARLLAGTRPSLDIAPLTNPRTGCVRPPLSPHRDGGHSTPLSGDLDLLLTPSTQPEQLHQLVEHLAAGINSDNGTSRTRAGNTSTDSSGHPYLPGAKRPLPAASAAALQQPPGSGDASALLWKVLVGAAASHWQLADIAALAADAPGLEHLRTRRTSPTARTPRAVRDRVLTLTRQWGYAVTFAASTPRTAGVDATFDTRAGTITDQIRQLQLQADASPGRWARGGGAADRRVLDALHTFALSALTSAIEADVRRLALTCGIGRETARVALHRLVADGWIRQALPATGAQGATWAVDRRSSLHRSADDARSQADTRPEGAGAAERILLLDELQLRLQLLNHDTFSSAHALPHAAGNTYSRLLPTRPTLVTDSFEAGLLERLRQHGLVTSGRAGWCRADSTALDPVAARLGVLGRLADRRQRYLAERDVWSWWQAEHDWMRTRRSDRASRRPMQQNSLWQSAGDTRYPKHPRRPDGRANYAAARTAHARGALDAITLVA